MYRMGGVSGSTVARSADRGATWTTWEVGDDANVITVVGLDDREGYALTQPSDASGGCGCCAPRTARRPGRTPAPTCRTGAYDLTVGSDGSLLAITPGGGTEPTEPRGCWSAGTTGGTSLSPGITAGCRVGQCRARLRLALRARRRVDGRAGPSHRHHGRDHLDPLHAETLKTARRPELTVTRTG